MSVTRDSLYYLSIEEAAAALREKRFSVRDLMEAHVARIAALDPRIHAFITHAGKEALDAADAADAELNILHVPYKGVAQGVTGVITGEVDMMGSDSCYCIRATLVR